MFFFFSFQTKQKREREGEITASDVKKNKNEYNTEQIENTICTYE